MACWIEMFAPPVVLVAGSRPEGYPPAKDASSRTVRLPPLCGGPLGLEFSVGVDLALQAARASSSTAAVATASVTFRLGLVLCLTSMLPLWLDVSGCADTECSTAVRRPRTRMWGDLGRVAGVTLAAPRLCDVARLRP